jgi:hypothetical protein
MSETLELIADEPKIDTAGKRALIESELRKDASRSDREIARVVGHGVDHKTVSAARDRLGIASPLGNSTPLAPINYQAPVAKPEPEENHFLPESESLVLPSQPAIAIYTNRYGQIVIRQEATGCDDEDHFVYICPHHLDAVIVRLRRFLP